MGKMPESDGEASDTLLLSRISQRDSEAMATLYNRYSRLVYSIGVRVLGDISAAEDLAHDIFLNLWREPLGTIGSAGLAPWLAVVSRNRAIDMLRRRRFVTDVPDDVLLAATRTSPEMETSQLANRARQIIASLSEEQRQAMELSFFEGMSHAEIAAKTGVPLGTIKTRIRSALQAVRKGFRC